MVRTIQLKKKKHSQIKILGGPAVALLLTEEVEYKSRVCPTETDNMQMKLTLALPRELSLFFYPQYYVTVTKNPQFQDH